MVTTFKNLVLKTATVRSVKLSTPADRIGSGHAAMHNPTASTLSQGQFLPWLPTQECEPGSRQQATAMRFMQALVIPASWVGSFPGNPASYRRSECSNSAETLVRHPGRTASTARLNCDYQSLKRNAYAGQPRLATWQFATPTLRMVAAIPAVKK